MDREEMLANLKLISSNPKAWVAPEGWRTKFIYFLNTTEAVPTVVAEFLEVPWAFVLKHIKNSKDYELRDAIDLARKANLERRLETPGEAEVKGFKTFELGFKIFTDYTDDTVKPLDMNELEALREERKRLYNEKKELQELIDQEQVERQALTEKKKALGLIESTSTDQKHRLLAQKLNERGKQ